MDHRGASEEAQSLTRDAVLETVEKEFPMLRCVEERTTLQIRPEAGWNRSKAVEWLVKTVCNLPSSRIYIYIYIYI